MVVISLLIISNTNQFKNKKSIKMKNDLSNKKVGDLVFVIGDGWLPITQININSNYPITVRCFAKAGLKSTKV